MKLNNRKIVKLIYRVFLQLIIDIIFTVKWLKIFVMKLA